MDYDEPYQWLWLYVAVEPTQDTLVCWVLPGIDSACFTAFLQALRVELTDERVHVVLDNALRAIGVGRWSGRRNLCPWPCRRYGPELNLAEQTFRYLRKHLANQLFADLTALRVALTQTLEDLWAPSQVVVRLKGLPMMVQRLAGEHTASSLEC
ncbi:MAG: transposase [Chloroflexota bacterium]|nr:transposase [Chloroflexota bacterium]